MIIMKALYISEFTSDLYFRRQWVREEDLAKDLKLHSKQLRRTLRFLEEEKLIMRDHRKEVILFWFIFGSKIEH